MSRFRSPWVSILLLLFLLTTVTLISVNSGALALSFHTLWNSSFDDMEWQIWLDIRLPRVLLAILVGGALAISGAIMQGLFRNSLADPGLLGISSGAALMVAIVIILPFSFSPAFAFYSHIVAAFVGGLIVAMIIFSLHQLSDGNLARLLLAGIAINALCMSFIGVLSYISTDQQLRQFSLWMMGSLSQIDWKTLSIATLVIIPVSILACWQSHKLNLLQLGDEEAHYLGLNVRRTKFILLLLSAILIGCAVALSGVIGFIGLVVPHLIRMRIGSNHVWLLPATILGGATLLLAADTLSRTLVSPAEIPVGLITGLIGGPYFLWLILRQPAGRMS
ncbi:MULTISPECIES: FecCD family ABC transporter permease [Proteus]|uniref:FecCD family ABC transporter permease n=1 Tax=Proteus TaxID=583 RepID=UPI000D686665|nr:MULTISPECIES: iron ABC transporter permease [Proteus]MCE9840940.1 iron ABC transporter permease [Proteus terrae]MCT8262689.1 iron ABC transporter permease [Proteus terrae]NBN70749.1 iron chelate uptake ABC transporter family permease subunit [Proteus sp. G2618]